MPIKKKMKKAPREDGGANIQSQILKPLDRIQGTIRVALQISKFQNDLKLALLKYFVFSRVDSVIYRPCSKGSIGQRKARVIVIIIENCTAASVFAVSQVEISHG